MNRSLPIRALQTIPCQRSLKNHVDPLIGSRRIGDIEARDLLLMIRELKRQKRTDGSRRHGAMRASSRWNAQDLRAAQTATSVLLAHLKRAIRCFSTGQTFLRGTQVTDGAGVTTFDTTYPGWYPGRTTHIHFKLRTSGSRWRRRRRSTSPKT